MTQAAGYFAAMVNNHPDLICEWYPDGTLTFANEAYCRYFGRSLDELIGRSCVDYIHPEERVKFSAHLSKLKQSQSQAVIEMRIIDPDGQVRWQQWIDKMIYDEATQETRILSSGRDITEFKQAERALNQRLAFERLITDLSINFINITPDDLDFTINHVLSEIGRFSQVDRAYIFIFDQEKQTLSNTHEWCDAGITPQIDNNQELPFDSIPWMLPKLKNFETIYIPQVLALDEAICPEKQMLLAQDIHSLLVVPLVNSGVLIGLIGFDSVRGIKTWSDDEATILRIVGSSIGSAIVQIKHTSVLAQQTEYLEKLNQITSASLNAKNLDEMIAVVARQIQSLISAQDFSIHLWNKNLNAFDLAGGSSDVEKWLGQIIHKESGRPLLEAVLQSTQPLYLEDIRSNTDFSAPRGETWDSIPFLCIPLGADQTKLGVVTLFFDPSRCLTQDEIALAFQGTSIVSQTMLKMRLLEQAQRSAREAETLHRTGTIVASALEPNIAIQNILEQLGKVVPFDSASVQILGEGYLEIKAGKGWPQGHDPVGVRFPVPGDNPNSKVIATRQPYILNNAPEKFDTFTEGHHNRIKSWMGVPLVVHEKVIGMLTLDHHQPHFYSDRRLIDLATAFADQVAISLENARLYAEEHQRVIELDALRATTADITQELGLESLLSAILKRATGLLNATGGELGLIDEADGSIKIAVSHKMGAENVNTVIEIGEGLMGYVAQTREIEMIEDYQHWSGRMETYKESKIHAAIAAPLMIGSRLLGVIGIMNSDRKRKFSRSEYSLMRLFSQQAAIAVENAKLYEESKRQARVDLVTEIYNRRGLFELGERELDRSKRYGRPLAAMMLDIDHFKRVNDTFGHPIGDLVLKELAQRLKNNLRTIDILARYGGEEFVILLPETTLESAVEVAERLRAAVARQIFLQDTLSLMITISLGVAVAERNNLNITTLIKHADQAMYVSKGHGRNRVTPFSQDG